MSDDNEGPSVDRFVDLFEELGYAADDESWQSPQDWLAEDSTDIGSQLLTDSEIVAQVTGDVSRDNLDSEPEEETEPQPSVSHAEAFEAFETALKWLEGQSDTDPHHLMLVRKWRDTAAQKRVHSMRQSSLLSYITVE